MRVSNFDLNINVDGVPLREYKVEVDPGTDKAVCWIESVPGQRFTVSVARAPGAPTPHGDLLAGLYLDQTPKWNEAIFFAPHQPSMSIDHCRVSTLR